MEARKHIGIVVPLAEQRGGAEQALLDYLEGTPPDHRGVVHLLFLREGPMVDRAKRLGYDTEVIDAGRIRQLGRYMMTLRFVLRWIRRKRLAVVFAWMSKAHLYTALPARLTGAKCVWFQHDVFSGGWLDRLNSTLPTDLVFCCSRAGAEAQSRAYPAIPVRAVHLAVDHGRFNTNVCSSPDQARHIVGLDRDLQTVVLVARLERWKGVHVFVEAARRLCQTREVQFVVVGSEHPLDPGYAVELTETVERAGLSDRIIFAGHQTNVPMWMCAADVIVHTSIKPEPFGIVMLEAMAIGRPLVASAAGGPLEVVSDGIDGVLIEPNRVELLAETINRLLDDDEERHRLGHAAPKTAAGHTPQRFASEINETLDALK